MIQVQRRKEPPPSLADQCRPFKEDVRHALNDDFFGKCYLCGGIASDSFDVEHLRPVCDFPGAEYSWQNLFPAHSRCNERRKRWSKEEREAQHKRWPRGGLLDCSSDDIDGRLKQEFITDATGAHARFQSSLTSDMPAANSANELNSIHSRDCFWGLQISILIGKRYSSVLTAYSRLSAAFQQAGRNWGDPSVLR